jgi:serine/threonine-protein kinase
MGVVHKGLDRELGRTVAVKLLPAELLRQPGFQERFRREGRTAAALSHGSIAAMHDIGEDTADGEPVPYLVMEYVDGSPLNEAIAAGPLPLDQVRAIVADVLDALEHSHRKGIVHRDVKPANVMVDLRGSRPRVKILDFGIAKLMGDTTTRLTATGHVIGTVHYISPEQADGRAASAKSDVYAVGCMLYELLTGRPPLTAETPTAVLLQHIRETPRPPSARRPDLPPAWDTVVMRALAKRPEDRYADAAEMQAAVLATAGAPAPRMVPDAAGAAAPPAERVPATRPAGPGASIAPTVRWSPQPPPSGPPSHGAGGAPGHGAGYPQRQPKSSTPQILSIIGFVCWFCVPPAAIILGLIAQREFRAQGRRETVARVVWIGGIVMAMLGILSVIAQIAVS